MIRQSRLLAICLPLVTLAALLALTLPGCSSGGGEDVAKPDPAKPLPESFKELLRILPAANAVGTWQRDEAAKLFAVASEAAADEQVQEVSAAPFASQSQLLASYGYQRSLVQQMKNEAGLRASVTEHQFADSDSAFGYFSVAAKGPNLSSSSWAAGRYDEATSVLSFVRGRYVVSISGASVPNNDLLELAAAIGRQMYDTPTRPLIVERLPAQNLVGGSVRLVTGGPAVAAVSLPMSDVASFTDAIDLTQSQAKMVVANYAAEGSAMTTVFVIQYRTAGDAESAAAKLRVAMTPMAATEPSILIEQRGVYVWGAMNREEESVLRVMPRIRADLPTY